MATVKVKRSSTPGAVPADLADGELACNTADGKLFLGKTSGIVEFGSGMTNPMTAAGDIIIGGTSGTPERLAKGTNGQVLTVVAGVPAYADASGGSATIDWTSPVVVTDTANLTYGKHYIVAVTSADKTLTLPEITAADYGKMIVVDIAAATTKLITIDGYLTQVIDGAAIRIMWASEVAQLVATANGWTKVGGKSIPMQATAFKTSNQLFGATVTALLVMDTYESQVPSMITTANTLTIKRRGHYDVFGNIAYNNTNATQSFYQVRFHKNGAYLNTIMMNLPANANSKAVFNSIEVLEVDDALTLYAFYLAGSFTTSVTQSSGTKLAVYEVPTW